MTDIQRLDCERMISEFTTEEEREELLRRYYVPEPAPFNVDAREQAEAEEWAGVTLLKTLSAGAGHEEVFPALQYWYICTQILPRRQDYTLCRMELGIEKIRKAHDNEIL